MKKLMSLLMIAVLTLACVGCGSDKEDAVITETPDTTESTEAAGDTDTADEAEVEENVEAAGEEDAAVEEIFFTIICRNTN